MENNKYQSNKHASNLHWNYFPCCCVWLFLLFCDAENTLFFDKHVVGCYFSYDVIKTVDVIMNNGRDENSPVIFLEYARHGVFFRSCCNLLSEEIQPGIQAYANYSFIALRYSYNANTDFIRWASFLENSIYKVLFSPSNFTFPKLFTIDSIISI